MTDDTQQHFRADGPANRALRESTPWIALPLMLFGAVLLAGAAYETGTAGQVIFLALFVAAIVLTPVSVAVLLVRWNRRRGTAAARSKQGKSIELFIVAFCAVLLAVWLTALIFLGAFAYSFPDMR